MVFAISATASNAQQTFDRMKEVIKSIFAKHGVNKIRPAIVVYADTASVRLNFDEDVTELEKLIQRIDNIPQSTGTPDLEGALQLAKSLFSGARPEAKKILVIITDSRSDSSPEAIKEQAHELEGEDVVVIPVGMGAQVDPSELKNTTPHKNNVILAKKTDDADDVANKILEKALEGIFCYLTIFISW